MHPQLTALMADIHNDDLKHAAARRHAAHGTSRVRRYLRHAHSVEQPEIRRTRR